MRLKSISILSISLVLLFCSVSYATEYDFPNMTLDELKEVKALIDEEINTNHSPKSSETLIVENATKEYIEGVYGSDNVDWAWFDYSYTKDWDFYTLKTHADIKKADGGKAQYDVYSEVVLNGEEPKMAYAMIGTEEILNERASVITDPRVMKQLGLSGEAAPSETPQEQPAENPEAATPETSAEPETAAAATDALIAQRGDKNDDALAIQEMLARLGYDVGTPDGSYGAKTEAAVTKFQEDHGLNADGIVTQSVFDALKQAAESAPEPEEVISISAVDLYNQFDNNAIAAESQYKGKTVQVSGTIDSIGESWGTPYVSLKADEYGFADVRCYFKKEDKAGLANLNSGQSVAIKGTCGDMGFASVDVQDCTVVG